MPQTPMPVPVTIFKYAPLLKSTDTRMILLHRGSIRDPIRCTLTNFDFTYEYEALSYEWGLRSEKRELILLNDIQFPIRKNLYHALLHLRRSTCDRRLWIDALCINQKDRLEKNVQLRRIGTIYARSLDALVWLGLAHDESDLAISHLSKIGLNNHGPKQALLCDESKLYRREVKAILALCNRPYWCRIWIIQEIRLAPQVTYCCGDKTIPGETFSLAGKYIQEATNPQMAPIFQQIGGSLASRIIDYTNLEDLTLKKWMIKTPDSLASDQKDRVYALINLAKDCRGRSELEVDCGEKVPFSKVYRDVLRVCSVDERTGKPVHDVLDLSYVLQRTLNNSRETVQLSDGDIEKVWICGIFSARITSFQRTQGAVRDHTLRPKNIFARDATSAVYTKSNNCILAPNAGQLVKIIRKRRLSDPNAPVQVVDGVSIASMPRARQPENANATETNSVWHQLRLADESSQHSKPFCCSGQNCSGIAPSDAMLGDWICRFPCSRIGLVFRHVDDQADAWILVGRAIMDDRFQISEKETEEFWMGKPQEPTSVSFGCDNAWYLELDMVTLQRLTAPEVDVHTGCSQPGVKLFHNIWFRRDVVRRWNQCYLATLWLLGILMAYGARRHEMKNFPVDTTRYLITNTGVFDRISVSGYLQRLIDPD